MRPTGPGSPSGVRRNDHTRASIRLRTATGTANTNHTLHGGKYPSCHSSRSPSSSFTPRMYAVFQFVNTSSRCGHVPDATSHATPSAPTAAPPATAPPRSAATRFARFFQPARSVVPASRTALAAQHAAATGITCGLIHTAKPQIAPSAAAVTNSHLFERGPARAASVRRSRSHAAPTAGTIIHTSRWAWQNSDRNG